MDRLDDHHERIGILIDQASDILDSATPAIERLAHVRWQLLRVMREYQLFKHTEIFDPLLASVDARRRNRAGTLKARCLLVAETYVQHIARWSMSGVVEADDAYLSETRALTRRLNAFLREERQGIAQLIEGLDQVRSG